MYFLIIDLIYLHRCIHIDNFIYMNFFHIFKVEFDERMDKHNAVFALQSMMRIYLNKESV